MIGEIPVFIGNVQLNEAKVPVVMVQGCPSTLAVNVLIA
jgi:hypothetical protein